MYSANRWKQLLADFKGDHGGGGGEVEAFDATAKRDVHANAVVPLRQLVRRVAQTLRLRPQHQHRGQPLRIVDRSVVSQR